MNNVLKFERKESTRADSEEWLTPAEAGKRIRRSAEAVRKLIGRGKLPAVRAGDRHILIAIEDLRAFLRPIEGSRWG